MRGAALVPVAAALAACGSGLTVPADACRGGVMPQLVGRNVGDASFAPGLPYHVVIPGSAGQPAVPGTLLLRVDEKGWITAAGCAR